VVGASVVGAAVDVGAGAADVVVAGAAEVVVTAAVDVAGAVSNVGVDT
jgi:hypothetical protein